MRSNAQLYLRLLRYVVPYWRMFALSLVAMVILAATQPAVPALMKPIMDGSFVDKDLSVVNTMALLLILVFLVRGLSSYLSSIALAWVAGRLVMDLRSGMFEKLIALPSAYLDKHSSGILVSKVTFDTAQVTEAGTSVLTILVRDSLTVIGLVGWMAYLDWKLSAIVLLAVPVVILIVKRFTRRLRDMRHKLQVAMGDITHALEEVLDGHKVVRIFGGKPREQARFAREINGARHFQLKFEFAAQASAPIAQVVTAIALAIVIYVIARQSAAGEITVGEFISFLTAMVMLFPPVKRLTGVNGRLQQGLAAAASVFSFMGEPSEPGGGGRRIERARGRLEIRSVSFSYAESGLPVLRDFSATIAAGETVALVGPSGSGKTTLIHLVPLFYHPTSGQIRLDGIEIRELSLESLRQNIALVNQDVVLFDDTVAVNIAYGAMGGATEAEIREAAKAAHALDFILALPDGFGTVIGENGVRLSGGQRQRIAIARAFLKDAPILILDEATSSLDSVSERHIQAALETLRKGRTTLVIAHRLSTIENADRILVLAGGELVESGSHTELLEHNRLYAGLYRFQFSRQRAETSAAGVK